MKKNLQKKVIKKFFTAFICVAMILLSVSEVFFSKESKVEAAAAEPNWYGGAYEAGINIYAMSDLYGQCTWYAWGRAYELTGVKLPCRNDAKTWYSVASNNGYLVGADPVENAIAVWSKRKYGHVAYVEAVNGNNVIISESNWKKTTSDNQYSLKKGIEYYSGRTTLTKNEMQTRYGTFLGYIYLTGSGSVSVPVSASGKWKITATDGVNVRSGAGTGYNKVGFYEYNRVVEIYEKVEANGYTWGHTNDGWFVLDYAESVSNDTEAPSINARVSYLTNKGFIVSADISDNVAVTDIKIAVWTETNGQDDIHWYSCMNGLSGNSFTANFDLEGYGYVEDTYNIHIYAYDAVGNKSGYPLTAYLDRTAPTGGNIKVSDVSKDGYTITCTANDNIELDKVCFYTWTEKNKQSNLPEGWDKNESTYGTISGNTVTYRVKTSDYNNETGIYTTSIYAFDKAGNYASIGEATQEIAKINQQEENSQKKESTEENKKDILEKENNGENKEPINIPDSIPSQGTTIGKDDNDFDNTEKNIDDDEIESASIEFIEKQITIETGEEDDLEYEIKEINDDILTWTSSDESIVTVEDGHITAIKAGIAEITTTMGTGESAKCTIIVKDPNAITSISLEKTKLSIYVGDTEWLDYLLEPEDADEDLLVCTSNNPKVAVIENGIITGKSAGKAMITVKYGDIKATCNVIVKSVSIKLKKTSATVKAGKKVKIQATVLPKGKLKYSSSNKKVATVNSKGVVKAKRKGKVVISVKANGVTKKFKVNVK